MSARNFLRSETYTQLLGKYKVLVLTPMASDSNFVGEFAHPDVEFIESPMRSSRLLSMVMQALFVLQTYWFTKKFPISTLKMLKKDYKNRHPLRFFLYQVYAEIFGRLAFFERILEGIYHGLSHVSALDDVLKKNNVDLVFATHGYAQEETGILLSAQKEGVPVVLMIHSWDNITSKSGIRQMTSDSVGRLLPARFVDKFIVWNEILADELTDMYGISKDRIFLSGIPQFDDYVHKEKISTRDEFFKRVGLDPKKKLLFYLATSPSIIHDQTVVINAIIDAMRSGKLEKPCQLLIRFHPRTDMRDWSSLFRGSDIFFQQPSAAYGALPVKSGWTKSTAGHNELAETMTHSDVVINGFSTSAIDGAVFDKPIICYAFDGDPANNKVVPEVYGCTHYAKLLALGGIQVAWNKEQLVSQINDYLRDPSKDAAGRENIRRKECYKLDGKAGARVAEILEKAIS